MSERPPGWGARTALGLGRLETAIMRTLWDAGCPLTARDIHARMGCPPDDPGTVSMVAINLYRKGLLSRHRASERPQMAPWWYEPSRPAAEHIGAQIAALLGYAPDPDAALAHALATARAKP